MSGEDAGAALARSTSSFTSPPAQKACPAELPHNLMGSAEEGAGSQQHVAELRCLLCTQVLVGSCPLAQVRALALPPAPRTTTHATGDPGGCCAVARRLKAKSWLTWPWGRVGCTGTVSKAMELAGRNDDAGGLQPRLQC